MLDPAITCGPVTADNLDGHFARCAICGTDINVTVTDVPFLDETGVERGRTSEYDISEYVDHFQTEHPDA